MDSQDIRKMCRHYIKTLFKIKNHSNNFICPNNHRYTHYCIWGASNYWHYFSCPVRNFVGIKYIYKRLRFGRNFSETFRCCRRFVEHKRKLSFIFDRFKNRKNILKTLLEQGMPFRRLYIAFIRELLEQLILLINQLQKG